MSLSSRWRVAARILVALGLLTLTDGGAAARTVPQTNSATFGLATIEPADLMTREIPAPAESGPFGLPVSHDSGLAMRWRRLQPVIHVETEVLALCRSNPKTCTPAAARFLSIIDAARARAGLARIGEINRAINLAIRPLSDEAQFGAADVWTTPLMTFANGAGDCEDYAIAKYVALRQAGMAARDLRLVILHNRLAHEDHAVTAARLGNRWLILDNQRMALLTDSNMRNVTPLLALDSTPDDTSPVIAAVPSERPMPTGRNGPSSDNSAESVVPISELFLPDMNETAHYLRPSIDA